MTKRFQHGSLQKKKRGGRLVWLGFWYDTTGKRVSKLLGTAAAMNKAEAQAALDARVRPVNERRKITEYTFGTFVPDVFAWKRRRWKASTKETTEDRINRHLIPAFKDVLLSRFDRTMLQDFLDRCAHDGVAWSIVAHLRWDVRMIFKFAVNEGLIARNPADLLYVPKAPRRERHVLTIEQAQVLLAAFPLRERLIIKLCGIVGLRPGEGLALKWGDRDEKGLHITRRVYRGIIDTPKSDKGTRLAALSTSVKTDLDEWQNMSPNTSPDAWIFPSENGETPVWPTNVWYDKIRPTLVTLRMTWVNFQVLRRSTASLMSALGVDGKVIADQLGHGLDVSVNTYTIAGINRQRDAVNTLDNALNKTAKTSGSNA